MRRVWLLACAVSIAACSNSPNDLALKVVLKVDPAQPASCVVLDISADGAVRTTQELVRGGKNEFVLGLKRGDLPVGISLKAHGFLSTDGCKAPRNFNGDGPQVDAMFPATGVQTVEVSLPAPDPTADADRDGFVAVALGGLDCNDTDPAIKPGAVEPCTGTVDQDCNGFGGCSDPVCTATPQCQRMPDRLAIVSAPQTLTTGSCSAIVNVEAQDATGSVTAQQPIAIALDVSPATGLTFFSDPTCATAATSTTIPQGQTRGSLYFRATDAGAFTVTTSSTGLTSATQLETLSFPPATALVFASPPRTVAATACSPALTLELRDATNVATQTTLALTVTLAGAPSTGLQLFSDSGCATLLTGNALTIAAGASSSTFYASSSLAGATVLTATTGALPPATQTLTVTAGAASLLRFSSSPQGIPVATCSSAAVLQAQDASGNAAAVTADATVTLSGPAGLTFYSDAACATAVTSVVIATATTSANFYFQGSVVGGQTISATAPGLGSDTQLEVIGAGPAAKLAITSNAQSIVAGTCSAQVTVQSRDTIGNPSNITGAALSVSLAATPAAPLVFYSDSACTTAVTAVPIAIGASTASFFFKSTLAGMVQLAVSSSLSAGDQQTETIRPGAATTIHFSNAPLTTGAGVCSAQLTVEARDQYLNPAPVSANKTVNLSSALPGVTFFGNSGCTGGGSASQTLPNNATQVSFYAKANLAAVYTLTAQVAGLGSDTQAFTVSAGAATALRFITPPRTVAAGGCTAVITAQRQDALANPSTAGGALSVTLSSTATTGLGFFTDPACTVSAGTSASIASGAAGVDFYVQATKVEAVMLTVAASGLTSDTQALTVTPGAAAKLVFTSAPRSAIAGACSQPVTITQQDAFGNAATVAAPVTIGLSDNGTNFDFHKLGSCGDAIATQVTLAANTSAVTVFFTGTMTGMVTMTAAATGLTSGTQVATIQTGSAAKLVFTTPARTVAAGSCSAALTIQRQDASSNPVTSGGALVVDLSSAALAGLVFHLDAACGTAGVTQATILAAASTVDVFITTTKVEAVNVNANVTGMTGATQLFTTTPGAPAKLVFTTPVQSTVAVNTCSAVVTVEQEDTFGNPVPAAGATLVQLTDNGTGFVFHLAATCADASASQATIPMGATSTSFYFQGSSVGPVTMTAASSPLTNGTQLATVVAGPGAKLAITTPARTISAGACSSVLTVQRQDVGGNPVQSGGNLTVLLSGTAVSGLAFYSDSACTAVVTQVVISAGTTSTDFYVSAKLPGSVTLTAAATGFTSATQGFTTNLGAPAQLAFTTPAVTMPALACSPLTTVTLQDKAGNTVNSAGTTTVTFSALAATGVTGFFSNNNCTTALPSNQKTIGNGASTASMYFSTNTAGPVTLNAAGPSLTTGTQIETISAALPTKLVFTTLPGTVEAGFCKPVTVERQDSQSRATSPASATTVTLTSSAPASGIQFFLDPACTMPLGATFDIPSGAPSTVVYVKGITGSLAGNVPGQQNYTLTAAAPTLTNGTLVLTVRPMVRRRGSACTLSNGNATVTCAITPELTDISRTILWFQASPGPNDTPSDDNATCHLNLNGGTGLAEVICDRFGNNGTVNIEWQTASFPYSYASGGVTVQHVSGGCTTGAANAMPIDLTLPASAPTASSFVLFSTASSLLDNDGADFFTTQLTGPTTLRVNQSAGAGACTQTMNFSAQVVSWANAVVNRGVQTGGSGASFTASQATTAGTPTFLLYSSRQTGDLGGGNNICRRRLRGEITNATTLTFTRGCTGADVQDISWEVVKLPGASTVQQLQGTMTNNSTTNNVAVTPVDLTRSFAFTGGLGPGGTASGSTDYATTDEVGMALARAVMNNATQLVFTRSCQANGTSSSWTAYVVQLAP